MAGAVPPRAIQMPPQPNREDIEATYAYVSIFHFETGCDLTNYSQMELSSDRYNEDHD